MLPSPTGITVYTATDTAVAQRSLMSVFQDPRRLYHFYLNADRTAITAVNIVPEVFANMDLETGPDGAFWYMSGGGFFPARCIV